MAAASDLAPLEGRLGYRFRDRALLEEALTHASRSQAARGQVNGRDNQRLEFLGDALLNLCVAHLIHRDQPSWDEGAMSKLRGLLVCTDSLVAWSEDLGLQLRRGAGRVGPKPLADAVEALLAAVFLDAGGPAGGLPEVLRLVESRFAPVIQGAELGMWAKRDAKTTLQERAAKEGLPAPSYHLLGQHGPDHAPRFRVRVEAGPHGAEAEGGTRKGAETEAARRLLDLLDSSRDSVSPKP